MNSTLQAVISAGVLKPSSALKPSDVGLSLNAPASSQEGEAC